VLSHAAAQNAAPRRGEGTVHPGILVVVALFVALLAHLHGETLHQVSELADSASGSHAAQHTSGSHDDGPAGPDRAPAHEAPHSVADHEHDSGCGELVPHGGALSWSSYGPPAACVWVLSPEPPVTVPVPPTQAPARAPALITELGIQRV
jgi:hypothetical protein